MGKRMIVAVAGLLASAGALTACGGSKSSSSESSTTAAAASADSTAAAATETTAASGGSGGDDAAYCAKVKQYKADADATDPALQSNDPKQIRTAFETILETIHDLDKDAPEAIAADVHTVRTLADELVATFDKYDYDFTKLSAAPEFTELSKKMDGPDMKAANQNLDKWGQDVCGIAPDTEMSGS